MMASASGGVERARNAAGSGQSCGGLVYRSRNLRSGQKPHLRRLQDMRDLEPVFAVTSIFMPLVPQFRAYTGGAPARGTTTWLLVSESITIARALQPCVLDGDGGGASPAPRYAGGSMA